MSIMSQSCMGCLVPLYLKLDKSPTNSETMPLHDLTVVDWDHLSLVVRKPVLGVSTRSDTNQAIQLQKMARGLKFRIYVAKTKALISFANQS